MQGPNIHRLAVGGRAFCLLPVAGGRAWRCAGVSRSKLGLSTSVRVTLCKITKAMNVTLLCKIN